ncbi:hypothetical protein GCM10022631_07380 [Deinococcus rubellus]|uniref:helix-turn-helix domain-containing protein n=1 Tax=Deinococcus rubellus TaxID=1889240 RepID=UPI0031EE00A1
MEHAPSSDTLGFGTWVREQRKTLWMTQKKLARLVGCAPVTIQKIEEGRRRPSLSVAEALARHLEIGQDEREAFMRLARTAPMAARSPPRADAPYPGEVGLPATVHPLIGREEIVSKLQQDLLVSPLRLLTLTGPPGVGKTRLAVQVAAGLRGAFEDGVVFVPLAVLDDPGQVLPTVSRRLGLPDNGTALPVARLIHFLRERQILLVLDNFEHLLGAAVPLAGVLDACPGLRLLITSRTALRLSGEQEWPLSPLAPGPAIQLFAERVRAFDPGFLLDEGSTPIVDEIVRRLDGLPLAIELAAVRLRYQPPEALAAALRSAPLTALGYGPADGPQRQHTLHSAIAWSYQRLDTRLQRVFRRLGVFVGGWEVVAAQAVAGAAPGDLESLLDGHLIRREGQRFTFLETLRAYALDQLDHHSEDQEVRDAHQAHYTAAIQAHQNTDLDWFEVEVGNLRAALGTQLAHSQIEAALRTALGMYWFWETRGYQREGLAWFSAVLDRPERKQLTPKLCLAALNDGSTMAWQSGNFDLSRVWLVEGLQLSRQNGDREWEAALLMHRGKIELEQGQYPEANQVLEPALRLARELSLPFLMTAVLYQLADCCLCLVDLDRAEALAEEALALCRQSPGLFWETPILLVLGLITLERGLEPLARQHLLRALDLVSGTEHRLQLTLILTSLAATLIAPEAAHAQLRQAARLWSCVQETRELSGYGWSVAFAERFRRWTTEVRQRLGETDWTLAWTAGRSMTIFEAMTEVERFGINEAASNALRPNSL